MIAVEAVTRVFGTGAGAITAVDDVSFQVERGEIVGFVGPNGAGKSTMLKMLATYLLPTSGRVSVAGYDVAEDPLEVRRRIGYLPGDTPLYGDMVVDDLLRFAARTHGLGGSGLEEALERTIDLCGLGPVRTLRVRQCSTGFRQRVGLSIALVHDPPVLLLDEPTHGFDPLQVMAFRKQLSDLKQDRAILFSTHIIADVEAVSDRVLIIYQGRLLGDGPVEAQADAAGLAGADLETLFAHLVSASGDDHGPGR